MPQSQSTSPTGTANKLEASFQQSFAQRNNFKHDKAEPIDFNNKHLDQLNINDLHILAENDLSQFDLNTYTQKPFVSTDKFKKMNNVYLQHQKIGHRNNDQVKKIKDLDQVAKANKVTKSWYYIEAMGSNTP